MNQTKKMREEKEETEEEKTFAKALEMVDKMKTYHLRKGIADAHSQVSEIENKIMNLSTQNLKQSSIISYFNKPVSSPQYFVTPLYRLEEITQKATCECIFW